MEIRVSYEGWVFELNQEGWLVVEDTGKRRHYTAQIAPDDLTAFAKGWVLSRKDACGGM